MRDNIFINLPVKISHTKSGKKSWLLRIYYRHTMPYSLYIQGTNKKFIFLPAIVAETSSTIKRIVSAKVLM